MTLSPPSFCRTAQDAMEIRRMLDENHSNIRIIAKIENQEGVNNVDEILAVVDGVMIARGRHGGGRSTSQRFPSSRRT